jgi:HD-like signal output (HDOD) protein
VDIEMHIYGFDHAELGARVCNKWNMPATVTAVVRNHHQFELPKHVSNDAKLSNIIRVVQMGDSFGAFLILNPESNTWDSPQLLENLEEECIGKCCSAPVATAQQLATNLEKILIESDHIISGLGIAIQ